MSAETLTPDKLTVLPELTSGLNANGAETYAKIVTI